jgi:DNA-binding GntR family transcriptional regulator
VTRDRDARVVEYASHLFRASRFDFTMTLIGK